MWQGQSATHADGSQALTVLLHQSNENDCEKDKKGRDTQQWRVEGPTMAGKEISKAVFAGGSGQPLRNASAGDSGELDDSCLRDQRGQPSGAPAPLRHRLGVQSKS